MAHPHFVEDCTLDATGGELSCDNKHRFRHHRLTNSGQIQVTCMIRAHTISPSNLPDDALRTHTRRVYEGGRDKPDLKECLRKQYKKRGLDFPDVPDDITWYVIEVSESEAEELTDNGYPEADQMTMSTNDEVGGVFEESEESGPLAMKISDWGLQRIPDEFTDRATPLSESEYQQLFS